MPQLQLTQTEIDERAAVLRRLRTLLEQQRVKFKEYLDLLEKQEAAIKSENIDTITSQAELEQQIIFNITKLQKVIKPMEEMYKNIYPTDEEQIPKMKADLAKLQKQVLAQNEQNRQLLKNSIVLIRNQLSKIKNPYANRKSIYSSDINTASIIDVSQ